MKKPPKVKFLDDRAVDAMDEMIQAKIPVVKFETGKDGYDFYFSRELSAQETQKAQEIATKHIPTTWT